MTSNARIANYTARATAVGLVLSVEGSWFRLMLSGELLILSMQFYKVRMRVRYYEKQDGLLQRARQVCCAMDQELDS